MERRGTVAVRHLVTNPGKPGSPRFVVVRCGSSLHEKSKISFGSPRFAAVSRGSSSKRTGTPTQYQPKLIDGLI